MTATDTGAALIRAILACPEEDAARLVFADWLDENGEPDRAEFIRVQCEGPACRCTYSDHNRSSTCRACALRAAHPEWSRLPCPWCGGKGGWKRIGGGGLSHRDPVCPLCHGSGDLLKMPRRYSPILTRKWLARLLEFRRGFLDSVTLRLDELLAGDAVSGLAKALVKALPLSRMPVSDREPMELNNPAVPGRPWVWDDNQPDLYGTQTLPPCLTREMPERHENGLCYFATREAALDALALAACRIARRAAGLPVGEVPS